MVLLVYSTVDYESFDHLVYWHQEMEKQADQNTIKFVVGTKIDITEPEDDQETVPKQVAAAFAKKINAQFFLTSAKDNLGIDKMFQTSAELCSDHMELRNDNDVSCLGHFEQYFYLKFSNVSHLMLLRTAENTRKYGRGQLNPPHRNNDRIG